MGWDRHRYGRPPVLFKEGILEVLCTWASGRPSDHRGPERFRWGPGRPSLSRGRWARQCRVRIRRLAQCWPPAARRTAAVRHRRRAGGGSFGRVGAGAGEAVGRPGHVVIDRRWPIGVVVGETGTCCRSKRRKTDQCGSSRAYERCLCQLKPAFPPTWWCRPFPDGFRSRARTRAPPSMVTVPSKEA
jgi:hypothetical protein